MTSTVSDCPWWCQWLPWFNGKWNWWPSQWQWLPVVESASQWQEEPKKSFRGILGFIFWIMNEWNQAGKSSASQHLPSANADRGAPVTSACLQASTARHWPSLIALGQEKSWIKLGQWHNQFNEIMYDLPARVSPSWSLCRQRDTCAASQRGSLGGWGRSLPSARAHAPRHCWRFCRNAKGSPSWELSPRGCACQSIRRSRMWFPGKK